MRSSFRMIARSVGYRMGKRQLKDKFAPNFDELFQPEYVNDALLGYAEGKAFRDAKLRGQDRDTFIQSK